MTCFDPTCHEQPKHDIRGLQMCSNHYIEALEHSSHLTSLITGDDHPIKVNMPLARKYVPFSKLDQENILKKTLDKERIL
jgi:hypothetical protein